MSTIKKIPMRKCTGCGELKPKKRFGKSYKRWKFRSKDGLDR